MNVLVVEKDQDSIGTGLLHEEVEVEDDNSFHLQNREKVRRFRMNKKLIQNGKPPVHKRMLKTKSQRKNEASERRRKNRQLQRLRHESATRAQVNACFKSSAGKLSLFN
jgi:hypothetical protein